MSENDFCELVLTCDTREQDKERVKAISDFFEEHGGISQNEKLDHGDYLIEGIYNEVPVKLNIEMKVLTGDLFPSMEELPTKLLNTYEADNNVDVALFIEEGQYDIKFTEDGLDAWIQNPAMQAVTGQEGIGKLSMYNNFVGSMAAAGIHVRPFRSLAHFPVTVAGLLKSIVKPIHRGLELKNPDKDFYKDMMNILVKLDGIGAVKAAKGLKYIPNLEWFNNASLEDLQDIFGGIPKGHNPKTDTGIGHSLGGRVYSFIHNTSRKDECAKNWESFYAERLAKHPVKSNRKLKSCDSVKENTVLDVKQPEQVKTPKIEELAYLDEVTPIFLNEKEIDERTKEQIESEEIKEQDLRPRVYNVLEYIRKSDRSMKEVSDYFGFSNLYCMEELYKIKESGKIWFNKKSLKWSYGHDMNEIAVTAQPEMNIGV